MDSRGLGALLVVLGLGVVLVGVVAWLGGLSWLGRLPGDLRIERGGVRLYVPITSMLLVSAALTLILWLLRRL
jgi:hypothetical protein